MSSAASSLSLGQQLRARYADPSPASVWEDGCYAADEYLLAGMECAALAYLAPRRVDAARLAAEIEWTERFPGVLRCEIYGQSILWDVTGGNLHATGRPHYEIVDLKKLHLEDADPSMVFNFDQILAYLLARFW